MIGVKDAFYGRAQNIAMWNSVGLSFQQKIWKKTHFTFYRIRDVSLFLSSTCSDSTCSEITHVATQKKQKNCPSINVIVATRMPEERSGRHDESCLTTKENKKLKFRQKLYQQA